MPHTRAIRVLLVEDNAVHAKIMRRAFHSGEQQFEFVHVTDGDDALDFLFHRGHYAAAAGGTGGAAGAGGTDQPDLMLLDLRLPTVDGFDVLEAIRGERATRSLPVVVVSTSDRPEDIQRSYELGANAYVVKSANYEALSAKLRSLHDFWGEAAELPHNAD